MGFTPWQAHVAPDYDRIMSVQCADLLNEIVGDSSRRLSILTMPQALHRELFTPFVPSGCEEYAGTYRGTSGTSLADRPLSAASTITPGEHYQFCPSGEVPKRMEWLVKGTNELIEDGKRHGNDYKRLLAIAFAFCWFGKIHPFLDGNGHIQRAIFAAVATEFGYPLSARFAIHPRPFDTLLAVALETFTRAPAGTEDQEIALASEYLGFFLDGPFIGVRKHLGTASPYI